MLWCWWPLCQLESSKKQRPIWDLMCRKFTWKPLMKDKGSRSRQRERLQSTVQVRICKRRGESNDWIERSLLWHSSKEVLARLMRDPKVNFPFKKSLTWQEGAGTNILPCFITLQPKENVTSVQIQWWIKEWELLLIDHVHSSRFSLKEICVVLLCRLNFPFRFGKPFLQGSHWFLFLRESVEREVREMNDLCHCS